MTHLKTAIMAFTLITVTPIAHSHAGFQDVRDVNEELPLRMEDTTPTPPGDTELQLPVEYAREENDDNRIRIRSNVQRGLARNWHGQIEVPVIAGNTNRTGSGDIRLETLYRLNEQWKFLPSTALSFRADLPTGVNSAGVDTNLKLILSETLGAPGTRASRHRIHLNGLWHRNAAAKTNEREHRFSGVIGYDFLYSERVLLLFDYYYEDSRLEAQEDNVVELGIVQQMTDQFRFSGGFGVGVVESSSDYIFKIGMEYSL